MEATHQEEVESLAMAVEGTVCCWRMDCLDNMKEVVVVVEEEAAKIPASAVVGQGGLLAVVMEVLVVECDPTKVEEREERCSMEVEYWNHDCLASMSETSTSNHLYQ
jgi:hypothetical protein